METGGVIASIVAGTIAIVAALVKMMDKNGIFCECKGCGCECKVDGRKSETRQLELQNKQTEGIINTLRLKLAKKQNIQTPPEFATESDIKVELSNDSKICEC